MGSIRCLALLCSRICNKPLSKVVLARRIERHFVAESPRFCSSQLKNETNPTETVAKDSSNSSEMPSESVGSRGRSAGRVPKISFEERTSNSIDTWYRQFEEKARIQPIAIDWTGEIEGKIGNWPFLVLNKFVNITRQVEGLYDSAESLMQFLESRVEDGTYEKRNFDVVLLAARVSICVHQRGDHEAALRHYQELLRRRAGPDGEPLLDHSTCSILVQALWKTKEWRECLRLHEVASLTQKVGPATQSYILRAALREGDDEVARRMLDDMEAAGNQPSPSAFGEMVRSRPASYLLDILASRRWVVSEKAADAIKGSLEKKATIEKVKVINRSCPSCSGSILPSQRIPRKELDALFETFSSNVFVRNNDLFVNSDPEEVDRFKEFMDSCPRHDVVIDAMNVMHWVRNQDRTGKLNLLSEAIRYFSSSGKNLLVMSRVHTKPMLEPLMESLKKSGRQVDWFFVGNQSKDDLFLLYAGLRGNESCLLITKDELRDHRFLLGQEMALTFKRWQEKHQVVFESYNRRTHRFSFMWPPKYEVVAQMDRDGTVHIPYMDSCQEHKSFNHTNSWLCIKGLGQDELGSAWCQRQKDPSRGGRRG